MVRVESFLGCFKLETGGKVIGWLSLVSNILGIITLIGGIAFLSVNDCRKLKRLFETENSEINRNLYGGCPQTIFGWSFDCNQFNGQAYGHNSDSFAKFCSYGKGWIIAGMIAVIVILSILGFISFLCIQGSKRRNHRQIRPMMILEALAAVACLFSIFTFTTGAIISGLIYALIYAYCFIVLYSLYCMFQEERERGMNAHYRAPGKF